MHSAEKNYLKAPQHSTLRQNLRNIFLAEQRQFDRYYSKVKRKFEREKRQYIERLNTDNPREFWKELKSIGPKKKKQNIPMEVYSNDGSKEIDTNFVLDKWKTDFESLYKESNEHSFDNRFHKEIMQEKIQLN